MKHCICKLSQTPYEDGILAATSAFRLWLASLFCNWTEKERHLLLGCQSEKWSMFEINENDQLIN